MSILQGQSDNDLGNEDLSNEISRIIDHFSKRFVSTKSPSEDLTGLHSLLIGSMEEMLIIRVLELCKGNKLRASKVLGIHRNTLSQKVKAIDSKIVKQRAV